MAKKPTKKPSKKPTKKPARKRKDYGPLTWRAYNQSPACKLTQKILDDFCEIVRQGNFRYVACQRLGISVSMYKNWMESGRRQIRDMEAGERPNLLLQGKLLIGLNEAEGFVHGEMVEDILQSGSISARQWYLERRFNKLYSTNPNAHTDDESGETVDAVELLRDRLKTILKGSD